MVVSTSLDGSGQRKFCRSLSKSNDSGHDTIKVIVREAPYTWGLEAIHVFHELCYATWHAIILWCIHVYARRCATKNHFRTSKVVTLMVASVSCAQVGHLTTCFWAYMYIWPNKAHTILGKIKAKHISYSLGRIKQSIYIYIPQIGSI